MENSINKAVNTVTASMKSGSYELRVKSETQNLVIIRDFISNYAHQKGVSNDIIGKIILAVDEASSNIIRHGYKNDPNKEILFNVNFTDDECEVTITDYGTGFDPSGIQRPDMPTYLKEKRVGGLGIHLMKMLMDRVEYNKEVSGANKLILIKKIA